jgi:nicotinamidase-related amidase
MTQFSDQHHQAQAGSRPVDERFSRRSVLKAGIAAGAGAAALGLMGGQSDAHRRDADPEKPALPPSTMVLERTHAALVVTDPQTDFLSPKGVTWDIVGQSVQEHNTVVNIGRLFAAAQQVGMTIAISPHYYYPFDQGWQFGGALEQLMHKIGMYKRPSPYSLHNFENSGADFMPEHKQYIHDGKTIVASPHKIYGPQANDLALQLRKNRVDQVVLAGMSANLCVESHLRHLQEEGFEVAVVRDATAGVRLPEGDGYLAALINFRYLADARSVLEDVRCARPVYTAWATPIFQGVSDDRYPNTKGKMQREGQPHARRTSDANDDDERRCANLL